MSSLPHPGRFVTAIIILASLTVQPVLAQSNMYGPETSPDSTRQVRPNPYTGQALRDTLAVLPDTARIDFVNDHFYQIYSADFELAVDVSAEAFGLSQSLGDVRRGRVQCHASRPGPGHVGSTGRNLIALPACPGDL